MSEESESQNEAAVSFDANGIRVSVKIKSPNAVEDAEKMIEKVLDWVAEVDED